MTGIERVIGVAAIPKANVKVAVKAKRNEPAVVVGVGLVAQKNALFAVRIGAVGIACNSKAGHDGVVATVPAIVLRRRRDQIAVLMVVIDKEIAVGGEIRRKGNA